MIDLRSDTVTRPTEGMRAAMASADVGDDVYGEDPTVNLLEAESARLLGKPAALFVSSGTQGNLIALLSHCARGDEYIAGQGAHTYRYEAGGAAVLGGIQPQPLPFNDRGELDLDEVRATIKPDDFHFARTRLLCLENTQAGRPLAMDYLARARELALERGLAMHLDGARLFNAAVALGVPAAAIAASFDSVSFCLSKGLGCPVGSILVGDADFIARGRRWRKMLGGGLRQAGYLAAAGRYAMASHIDRLQEDHDNAERLAAGLAELGLPLAGPAATNMVMLDAAGIDIAALRQHLAGRNITISGPRLVTHLDVSSRDIDEVVSAFADFRGAEAK